MKNVAKKILNVVGELKPVSKDGVNSFHNYKYVSDAQIIESIRGFLVKHGLCVIPNQVSVKREDTLSIVEVDYTLYDVDSGESMVIKAFGYGQDKGDKGLYKSLTGAEKYLFMKTFLIPTFDDPENEKKKMNEPSGGNHLSDFDF